MPGSKLTVIYQALRSIATGHIRAPAVGAPSDLCHKGACGPGSPIGWGSQVPPSGTKAVFFQAAAVRACFLRWMGIACPGVEMIFHLQQAQGQTGQDTGGLKHGGHFRRPQEETGRVGARAPPRPPQGSCPCSTSHECQTIISDGIPSPSPCGIPGKPLISQIPLPVSVFMLMNCLEYWMVKVTRSGQAFPAKGIFIPTV